MEDVQSNAGDVMSAVQPKPHQPAALAQAHFPGTASPVNAAQPTDRLMEVTSAFQIVTSHLRNGTPQLHSIHTIDKDPGDRTRTQQCKPKSAPHTNPNQPSPTITSFQTHLSLIAPHRAPPAPARSLKPASGAPSLPCATAAHAPSAMRSIQPRAPFASSASHTPPPAMVWTSSSSSSRSAAERASSSPSAAHSSPRGASSRGSASSRSGSERARASRGASSLGYWDVVLGSDAETATRASGTSATRSQTKLFSKAIPRYCAICQVTYTSLRAFDEHLSRCASEDKKTYVCEHCGLSFRKSSNMTKHIRTVHLGEKNYRCTEAGCGRLFGQKSNLSSHVRAVHQREKPFQCPRMNCSRSFSQKSGLRAHVKTVHEGQRPHVCECGASFGQSGDLNRHVRMVHEKIRPFECPICPQLAFGRKSVLQRHMQLHRSGSSASDRYSPSSDEKHK